MVCGCLICFSSKQNSPAFLLIKQPISYLYSHTFVYSCNKAFENTKQIDKKLILFNRASLQYYNYQPLQQLKRKKFVPTIFYLRQVREDEKGKSFVEVANTAVRLPKTYLNYFVFVEWNLTTEELTVSIEKEKQLGKIKSISLKLNPTSKQKIIHLLKNQVTHFHLAINH